MTTLELGAELRRLTAQARDGRAAARATSPAARSR